MKKVFKPIYLVLFGLLSIVATSCSEDDDTPTVDPVDPVEEEIDPDDFQGSFDEDITLDATVTYHLTGVLSIEDGATLTIPAGTEIVATSDGEDNVPTSVYIVIQKGGMIDIQGTASAPVVMYSDSSESGSWGGIVIAGNAISTDGTNLQAEVDNILYGGDDATDDSGSINYLILSDAGAQISPDSQYNGISLYAVGSGTTIQNVAILNGADDGIEFFGGSVSATNLYLENNEDDAVDWTEGWDGSVDNVYVNHTIENFSTAIEADGLNGNPTITNFTAVSTTGGTALQFKAQSGATITGLSLSGYDTNVDITEDERTDLSGIQIEGEDADLEAAYDAEATVDAGMFGWVNENL